MYDVCPLSRASDALEFRTAIGIQVAPITDDGTASPADSHPTAYNNSDNNEARHDAAGPIRGASTTSRSGRLAVIFAVLAAITAVVTAVSTLAGSSASLSHGRAALPAITCAHHAAQLEVDQFFAKQHEAPADNPSDTAHDQARVAYDSTGSDVGSCGAHLPPELALSEIATLGAVLDGARRFYRFFL